MIEQIIQGIWDDIDDRDGLHLHNLDESTKEEIKESWRQVINIALDIDERKRG